MKVGVSGHQKRDGADWGWTEQTLRSLLISLPQPLQGWSSLAVGADQLFVKTVLELGGSTVTVVPGDWYEECYDSQDSLSRYRQLLAQGDVVQLDGLVGEEAFLEAGRRVVEECDALVAIWDGEPAHGRGGTADVVDYAKALGKTVHHIDPIRRRLLKISGRGPTGSVQKPS